MESSNKESKENNKENESAKPNPIIIFYQNYLFILIERNHFN